MAVTTEPAWLNKTTGISARNGTASHTISFGWTAGTGTFLVFIVNGAVTHTNSAGWTERLQPVNSAELSLFTKTGAGETSITLANNGANYPVAWVAYEFPAGTTYTAGTSSSVTSDTFPALSGLPGSAQVIIAARGRSQTDSNSTASTVWTAPWVEDTDQSIVGLPTDGIYLSAGHQLNVTTTSITPAATTTYAGGQGVNDRQHVVIALNVAVDSGTTETSTGSGTAIASASASTASTRVKTATGLADAVASSTSTSARAQAQTATAVASASRVSAGVRAIIRTAAAIISASRTTASTRSSQRVAAAVASAARTTTSARVASRVATAVASASAVSGQGSGVASTGLAVAKALASATQSSVRSTSRLATAVASATRTSAGTRTSARTAPAKAVASATKSSTRVSARTATSRLVGQASTLATRLSAALARAFALASGVASKGADPADTELTVTVPYGSLFQVGALEQEAFEITDAEGNIFTVAQEVSS